MWVKYQPLKKGKPFPPSSTIPDQSYTVKELFKRFAKGLPIHQQQREAVFLGEENEVDLHKVALMDSMDKADLSADMAARNRETEQEILQAAKERRDAKAAQEAAKAAEEAAKAAGQAAKA